MSIVEIQSRSDVIDFITNNVNISWNLKPEELVNQSLLLGMGQLSNNNVLAIDTGEFTGRSPKDRFIVKDIKTKNTIDWGYINQSIHNVDYQKIKKDLIQHLNNKKVYGRYCYACADLSYKLNIQFL